MECIFAATIKGKVKMDYCILSQDKTILNIIVCENDEISAQFGAVPSYEGARIGGTYDPPLEPEPEPQATDTEVLNALLGVSE